MLDWYPVLKRTDQTGPGIGGGERGGSTGIGYWYWVLSIKRVAYQSGIGVRVEG